MKKIRIILLSSFLIASSLLLGQENESKESFSISSQLRSRAEYRNGALNPLNEHDVPAAFINNRARISMNYLRSNLLELKLSAQHVSVWGEDPQIDRNGRFMLNEAWGKLNFNTFFVQIGRQTLSYDDERILGGLDWNVSGRFHDALKAGYENQLNKVHLILAFNQSSERQQGTFYAGGQPHKSMQTLWYHYGKPNTTPFNISALAMNLGYQLGTQDLPKHVFMQTVGVFATYNKYNWDINGSFYYQTGKNRAERDVFAYMGSLYAKYTINSVWAVGIGSDYLSGDRQDNITYQAFDPLYGTHHKFYGTMDYFYASPFRNGLNPGLWDNQLAVFFKPAQKVDLSLNYHHFSTTRDVLNTTNEKIKRGLGSEFDFQVGWTIMPDVKLIGGYSFMLGTKSMNVVKGGDYTRWQDWGWVSINITPKLFSTK